VGRPDKTRGVSLDAIHGRYAAGVDTATLAAELGITPDCLRKKFRRAGLPTRQSERTHAHVAEDAIRAAHARYMRGELVHALALELGMWPGALRTRFRALGLELFRSGRHPNSHTPRAGNYRNAGQWTVRDEHECIESFGACVLCDRSMEEVSP
jgi:hypothetical protein